MTSKDISERYVIKDAITRRTAYRCVGNIKVFECNVYVILLRSCYKPLTSVVIGIIQRIVNRKDSSAISGAVVKFATCRVTDSTARTL